MRRISSRLTFYYKRIFPIAWVGFGILMGGVSLFTTLSNGRDILEFLPFAAVLAVVLIVGITINKKFSSDLADEVWDDGSSLVVKDRGQEQRIELADIKNIGGTMIGLPRVVLSLRRPTVFGEQVAFAPPMRFVPFATSPIVDDLIERVDRARESSRRR